LRDWNLLKAYFFSSELNPGLLEPREVDGVCGKRRIGGDLRELRLAAIELDRVPVQTL
jgi:hypothetical protein